MSDVYKALADPTRRAILDELAERDGQTLFELCARLATRHRLASSPPALSPHAAVPPPPARRAPAPPRVPLCLPRLRPARPRAAGDSMSIRITLASVLVD